VDHQTKCVFNGSALGKQYSAKAIQERCSLKEQIQPSLLPQTGKKTEAEVLHVQTTKPGITATSQDHDSPPVLLPATNLLDDLLQPEQAADYLPAQLKKKGRKKKKRKNISNNQ